MQSTSTDLNNIYYLQTKFAKVMFLHVSVSHSVLRGVPGPRRVSDSGGVPGPGGSAPGGLLLGDVCSRGAWSQGGWSQDVCLVETPREQTPPGDSYCRSKTKEKIRINCMVVSNLLHNLCEQIFLKLLDQRC